MKNNKSILIADGGSTKVDWVLLQQNDTIGNYQTGGLNPFILNKEQIALEIQQTLVPQIDATALSNITEIYFYGAGCSSRYNCEQVKLGIQSIFKQSDIVIDHDMLGAAKALCGQKTGVACILGTGSNCCVYDGENITTELICLGHLAGDEGSGNHIGKKILQSYCYDTMPADIRAAFFTKYKLSPKAIVAQLYKEQKANTYLATFSKFLKEHPDTIYTQQILESVFDEFISKNVCSLNPPPQSAIHFTGSVAFYFKEILEKIVLKNGFEMGQVIRKPISGMVAYHCQLNLMH